MIKKNGPEKNCCLRSIRANVTKTYKSPFRPTRPILRSVREPKEVHFWNCFFLAERHCHKNYQLLFSPFYMDCCMLEKQKRNCYSIKEACAMNPSKYAKYSCCLEIRSSEKPVYSTTAVYTETSRRKITAQTTEMMTEVSTTTKDPVDNFDPRK